ncbi:MAG: protein adenylyltransferase SelO [Burkholderiales bacterium]
MATVVLPGMPQPRFDNAFVRELPGDVSSEPRPRQVHGALYSPVDPTRVAAPRLIAHSPEVSAMLGFPEEAIVSQAFADVFGGNAVLAGMQPYAASYGGHQFGQWAGQLGDGRAITLGELIAPDGERYELQLKGAGKTAYSRTADGRAVLRSSIREFLCSEAMHHLGVPTTRALSLVGTGEDVIRDMFYDGNPRPEPGAIVCRVAPSFIRFGNFELPAARNDRALLERLIDFTIAQYFAHLLAAGGTPADEAVRGAWFAEVCERTARMVAHWMRVGFVHGVMNTDNMSILGLTIDYGPYGWVDNFDRDWTPNTTDAERRRYRFGQQPQIAYWNLGRLANALATVFGAHEPLHAGLQRFVDTYVEEERGNIAAKLGLAECTDEDVESMNSLYELLERGEIDMTLFFRGLSDAKLDVPSLDGFAPAFYDDTRRDAVAQPLLDWLRNYVARVRRDGRSAAERQAQMHAANPRYVLRNYLAQEAIDLAEQGDYGRINELLDVMRRPYDDQPGCERFAARRPDWARSKAGCSTLSCSS